MNEHEARPLRGHSRIPVPGSVFVPERPPEFLLFDSSGRTALPHTRHHVFVSPADIGALREYVYRNLGSIIATPGLPEDERTWTLHRALLWEAASVLGAEERTGVARLVHVARMVARCAQEDPAAVMPQLAGQPHTPATHAAGTALYAAALWAARGGQDLDDTAMVILAGVFADSGKRTLPQEMLNRSGPLDEREWGLIRLHPQRSVEIMRKAGVISALAVRAVRGHHERWGGGGYPDGAFGTAIPVEARVLAIADTFSALSMHRPFQHGSAAYDALLEMSRTPGQFEPTLLRTFVRLLGGLGEQRLQPVAA